MKNKLFLPLEPNGSLNLPAALVKHLGLPTDELVGITIPSKTSRCNDCEELELRLTACCDENLCNGYTTHDDIINLPQELLDIADIPAGAELHAVCSDGNLMFITEDRLSDTEMTMTALDIDPFILPLSELGDCID